MFRVIHPFFLTLPIFLGLISSLRTTFLGLSTLFFLGTAQFLGLITSLRTTFLGLSLLFSWHYPIFRVNKVFKDDIFRVNFGTAQKNSPPLFAVFHTRHFLNNCKVMKRHIYTHIYISNGRFTSQALRY